MSPVVPGEKYYGKYRGLVSDNNDPDGMARVQARVYLGGDPVVCWATPCVPLAGPGMGVYCVPPLGASVWVEFEEGNVDLPVLAGYCWDGGEALPPLSRLASPGVSCVVVQTELQNGLIVSDLPGPTGGITLKSASGATLIVNDTGIYIQNGAGASITMVGPVVTIVPA